MHPRRLAAALTAALAFSLTSCSGSGDPEGGTGNATPTPSSSITKASPSPSPTSTGPLALKDVVEWKGEDLEGQPAAGNYTVLGYEQPVGALVSADEENGTEGYVWAALEVKACVTKGSWVEDRPTWVLSYSDGARVDPSSVTYDDFPRPEYPAQVHLGAGDCVRGKIVYAVPEDQRPETAVYAPLGVDDHVEWVIPAE